MKLSRQRARRIASRLIHAVGGRKRRRRPGDGATPCPRGRYVTARTPPGSSDPIAAQDTTLVITSASPDLLAIARSFLDDAWPVYVIDGSERCYGFSAIQHAVENVPARWAVLLDEDAFVLDNTRLRELVAWAAGLGVTAVGVPDGGVIAMRVHNPNALNPFFNILDLASIRGVWNAEQCLRWSGRGSEMTSPWPPRSLLKPEIPYVFDDYEPYYCFYFWLEHVGLRTSYLDARTHSDGLSTIVLDHEQRPLVVHTWYARKFENPSMRDRILDVAAYARGEEDRGERWRGHDWSHS